MDDYKLIQACLAGSKAAWDEFVDRYSNLIYDAIARTFRQYGCPQDKENLADIHHDTFVVFLDNGGRVLRQYEGRNGCGLGHYVRTVAIRRTIDHLRKRRKTLSIHQDPADSEANGDITRALTVPGDTIALLIEKDNADMARQILEQLPGDDRVLCSMIFLEKQEPARIAQKLGITIDNVYTSKKRLLQRLRAIAIEKKFLTPE